MRGGEMTKERSFRNLVKKAENLKEFSYFELAEMEKSAERGKGPLAGLSKFEISCVMMLCEGNKKSEEK